MAMALGAHADVIDESKLPPAATNKVDFVRDIKPIFDNTCLRCHGPQKPKSGFRLDTRAAALKGGDDGVDIQPGNSAKSPLIHYVAGLVSDMMMPPEGKGDPLTKEQVGLLRAWIDQGVEWNAGPPTNLFDVTISTTIGGTVVSGDNKKFREHSWRTDGIDGGLTEFDFFEQVDSETRMRSTGHFSVNDYKLTLDIDRNDRGFVHSGWQEYRQYYDDLGGYNPLTGNPPQRLGKDLSLEVGKAWVDFGLTLPHWPRMVLGYEYDYKRGEEATTAWGSDFSGDPRNIAPNSKRLNEATHVIKFDLDGEYKGFVYEDRFRGEFYKLGTYYTNVAARASMTQEVNDGVHYFQGANSVRAEKKVTDWLLTSAGYFYSKLNSDESFSDITTANVGVLPAFAQVHISRESHLFNVNGIMGPFAGLTISLDAQSEWTRQVGLGGGTLNGIAYARPPGSNLQLRGASMMGDYDQRAVWEGIGLRYTTIPYTTLFADARLRQETIGHTDSDIQDFGDSFLENTTDTSETTDFRAGFNTSPWQWVSVTGHYRRYENNSSYRTNVVALPVGGYPGFIASRDLISDEVEGKVVTRPFNWLKTSLGYQFITTKYRQDTRSAYDAFGTYSDGGWLQAGKQDLHIYSLGLILTPVRRLSLATTFSYQDSTIVTENSSLVPEYKGNVYSVMFNGTFVVNAKTDFTLGYSVSIADYLQNNQPNPLSPPPLGMQYEQHAAQAGISRRFNNHFTGRLQYAYFRYNEPSLLGFSDYNAHSVFATLTYHFR